MNKCILYKYLYIRVIQHHDRYRNDTKYRILLKRFYLYLKYVYGFKDE